MKVELLRIQLEKLHKQSLEGKVVWRVRVKEFKVDIDDALLVASSCSEDRMVFLTHVVVRVVILFFPLGHLAIVDVYYKYNQITRPIKEHALDSNV